MSDYSVKDIQSVATRMRRHILIMAANGKTSHVGSALSCVEILAVLYFRFMNVSSENWLAPEANRFILSKGHGAKAWYAVLAEAEFISLKELDNYAKDGSYLGEHPSHCHTPGIGLSTGSLGHGLGVGAGQALAKKLDQRQGRVFVLVSDGECNEGSIWEAAMCATQHKLDNLMVIVDDNHMQAMGPSRQISALDSLKDKWAAFGWKVKECDGHDIDALINSCEELFVNDGKPSIVIARTVLGKGVSFMEDKILWHYQIPSEENLRVALKELEPK